MSFKHLYNPIVSAEAQIKSGNALRWALQKRGLPTHAKLLLIHLAGYAVQHGRKAVCWPSVHTLVQDTGLPRAAISRALTILENTNLIARDGRAPGGWKLFVLNLEQETCHKINPPNSALS